MRALSVYSSRQNVDGLVRPGLAAIIDGADIAAGAQATFPSPVTSTAAMAASRSKSSSALSMSPYHLQRQAVERLWTIEPDAAECAVALDQRFGFCRGVVRCGGHGQALSRRLPASLRCGSGGRGSSPQCLPGGRPFQLPAQRRSKARKRRSRRPGYREQITVGACDDAHKTVFREHGHGAAVGTERKLPDADLVTLRPSLIRRQAGRDDFRIGKADGRNAALVPCALLARNDFGNHLALRHRPVGEHRLAGNIADAHGHRASRCGSGRRCAGIFRCDPGPVRPAPSLPCVVCGRRSPGSCRRRAALPCLRRSRSAARRPKGPWPWRRSGR